MPVRPRLLGAVACVAAVKVYVLSSHVVTLLVD